MNEEIDDFERMISSLIGDIKISLRYLTEVEANQFWRRTYIRTVFAFIEALIFHIKRVLLRVYDAGIVEFSPEELAMLREESYDLSDKGDVVTQQKFIPLTKNLKFICKAYVRYTKSNYTLKVDDSGWDSFKKSIDIRNRLTHPKSASDLDVSDDDIKVVERADNWFKEVTRALLELKDSA
ncbi:MAG: hypothetical protein QOG00_1412 [Pyrinomonadaceae bacterium]|nr:hypothetical protein [Pyrinomonadaceae bacterium]